MLAEEVDRRTPYFEVYAEQYTDLPLLVTPAEREPGTERTRRKPRDCRGFRR
ncbi:hypothetical protein ABZ519_08755 [Streptomyces collinus]|uniref:hypothetical protein n=1 Tax=Streptomyces collinus TaxID=42684 RepID=UPI0033DD0BAA